MSIQTESIKPSINNDPTYRYVSVGFLVIASIAIFLVMWFIRDEVPLKAPRTITLYSFTAMETVMEQALIPAFQDYWMDTQQDRVEFINTFAGAGVITRQIMTQFPAEVAILSSELDARRLVSEGIINAASWQELQSRQKFCRTPIVLFVRDDLPIEINSFDGIDFEGLNVVIPDPLISGEGQMTSLALFGSRLRQGDSEEAALKFVSAALGNVKNRPSNSQDALEQFHAGIGDVLFNYEAARSFHPGASKLKVIYPISTIMVEPIAVAIHQNVLPGQERLITGFLEFLWDDTAQKILSDYGFQTINTSTEPEFVPAPDPDIFTLNDLGNAIDLNRNVIDPLLKQ